MALTSPPPAERFLRGQRAGTRTKRWGRGLIRSAFVIGALGGLTGLGVWGAFAMSRAPELTVHRVRVEGNQRLSDEEILELLELTDGSNILTLDLDEVREKLLRSAWIRDVALERVLPATLTLSIEERDPVAVAVMGGLYLLADDGTVLAELSPFAEIKNLVLARGVLESGGVSEEKAALAGRVASLLESDSRLAAVVSEIDVGGGSRSIAVRLRGAAVTLLVEEKLMLERLRETIPLLEGITETFPTLEVVDLRFSGRVYLRVAEASRDGGESF